ncbi:hypothetical protein [Psychroserpens mesophilus]|uniref:hypothetical protein n=1 Tax=Psychroserpens mesophilus TaxID=325473 RepID=UPI003D64F391
MKKLSFLFSLFVLLTAFTCENEPLEGDFTTEDVLSCEIAAQNTQDAAIAFLDVTDENYTQLCIAYRNALEVQIEFCGDPDGILQTQINSLGDCGATNPDPCETVTIAANNAETAYDADPSDSSLCSTYLTALQIQITVCGDSDGSIQAIIDGLDDCGGVSPDPCDTATTVANNAESAYNANTSDSTLCNEYKVALQNKITFCGDTNGSIQAIIDDLGDCAPTNVSGTLSVTAGTLNIQFIVNNAVLNSGVVFVTGSNTEQGANYFIEFEVPEGTTGVDVMQNFKLTLNNGEFFPNMDGFDDFTNNITVNSGGVIQGTFGGIVTRTDGADLNLAQGLVDLEY